MPFHQSSGRRTLGGVLAFGTMLAWGVLPLALSVALERLDAVTITGFRFAVSVVVLAAALRLGGSRPSLRTVDGRGRVLLAVATGFLAANYLFYLLGLKNTTPADAQVLIQTAPLLLGLLGLRVFGESYTRLQWVGLGLIVTGLTLFSGSRFGVGLADPGRHLLGNGLIGLAAITWAVYGAAQKQLLQSMPSQHILVWIYAGCALGYGPFTAWGSLAELDGTGWAVLLFCALNTVVAYGCFSEALQHWEASRVSAVLALTPLVSVGLQRLLSVGWGFDPGPALNPAAIGAAFVVVAGSLLTALGGGGLDEIPDPERIKAARGQTQSHS